METDARKKIGKYFEGREENPNKQKTHDGGVVVDWNIPFQIPYIKYSIAVEETKSIRFV